MWFDLAGETIVVPNSAARYQLSVTNRLSFHLLLRSFGRIVIGRKYCGLSTP